LEKDYIMRFDNFELARVAEFQDGSCEPITWDDRQQARIEVDGSCKRTFWTIYGHLPEGGVDAIVDVDDQAQAQATYELLQALIPAAREPRVPHKPEPTPGPWRKWLLSPDSDPHGGYIITTADGWIEITGIIHREIDADLIARIHEYRDACTDKHVSDALEELAIRLDDEDAGNDEVRDAAIAMREALESSREHLLIALSKHDA
jgi:hypothetical protein